MVRKMSEARYIVVSIYTENIKIDVNILYMLHNMYSYITIW